MTKNCRQPSNISPEEFRSFIKLNRNQNIVIQKFHKVHKKYVNRSE